MPLNPKQQPPYYTPGTGTTGTQIYRVNLQQGSTNPPTQIIYENDLSGPIVWTRTGVGTYLGTLTAAFPTEARTFLQLGAVAGFAQITWQTANTILIETFLGDFTPSDDIIANVGLQIIIYPA